MMYFKRVPLKELSEDLFIEYYSVNTSFWDIQTSCIYYAFLMEEGMILSFDGIRMKIQEIYEHANIYPSPSDKTIKLELDLLIKAKLVVEKR